MSTADDPTVDQTRSNAFLEGQGVAVELGAIEDELDRLWGPAAEQAGGPELDHPSVTRVVLANLVVAAMESEGRRLWDTLDAITTQYPSRTIILRPGAEDQGLSAEVSALCHLPAPGRPQVCSERIVLHCGRGAESHVPSAIRPLLVRDLHTILWWCDDPHRSPDLLRILAREATRLILDRPDPDPESTSLVDAFDLVPEPLPRDLTWFSITPWREILAQLFDPPANALLEAIETVQVRVASNSGRTPPRVALWLISWLAGQLGWAFQNPVKQAEGAFRFLFDGSGGPVQASIEVLPGPTDQAARLTEVEVHLRAADTADSAPSAPGLFHLKSVRDGSAIRIEVHARDHCELPRLVSVPQDPIERRVAAALQSYRYDSPYDRALPILRSLIKA